LLSPQVPEQVKQDRRDELISLVQKSQRAFARRQVRTRACTKASDQNEWQGWRDAGKSAIIPSSLPCSINIFYSQ
jgi:hypothetical protein